MKAFFKAIGIFAILFAGIFGQRAQAQTGVLNPADPIVVYNPASPPATPAYGTLAKWVKTDRVGYNTSSFKAYYYKGMAFRLKFPKSYQHGVSDGKKYPLFIFFHGIGEKGSVYDNEYQLYHGGELFRNAVDNGDFDGFLLYPQTSSGTGYFNNTHYSIINELVNNYLVPEVKVDINRVIVDGLSGGGGSTWNMLAQYPQLIAAGLPISAAAVSDGDASVVNANKFTPIWLFQGELDVAPTPFTAKGVVTQFKNAGGNISYTEYPGQGHGVWYSAWTEPNFFPFINKAHKANPWPLTGRTEFCPGDAINVTLGVTPGFTSYKWRKNGVEIPGATSNTYVATSIGVYDCSIKRGTEWSVWSPIPVEIKLKGATVSPDITVSGLGSKVIPSPDGKTSVLLQVPTGYATYNWQRDGNATVLSNTNTLSVNVPGNYKVKVTEQFGCSSDFSNLFSVIDANGANGPSAASAVVATAISKTAIRLDWAQNPSPAYNETGFEIYRASSASGPYSFVGITGPDATTFTNTNLNSGSAYYYKIRAVNNNGASATTDPVTATTQSDVTAPSAPGNLRANGTTRNSVTLLWNPSTDDVGVVEYDIYVNGIKTYETETNEFTVFNLQQGQTYTFRVKARDFAGNASPFSNQVSSQAIFSGLSYKYYTFTGTWNNLPDFNTLDPVATGIVPNVTIANRTQGDNFAYLWEGFINIPVSGTYTFRTNSDDGSKLYLSPYTFGATALVNNDGLHGGQDRDGTITLNAGVYPIAITFYEQGGGEVMNVSWKTPGSADFVPIPNSAFADQPVVDGVPPSKPTNVTATAVSFKRINLAWTDNSDNESGFEIWRSTNATDGFTVIGSTGANQASFADSLLDANTTYYYRIKAIGQYGESDFDRSGPGLDYAYYELGGLGSLPDFSTLTPKKTGRISTFDISPRDRGDDFLFKFSGSINIPTTGIYTFYTSSDDGSKLYIDGFDAAHQVVNNDGLHGTQEASGTVTLTAGSHTIYATFFEAGGGEVMEVRYSGDGIPKQLIPASVLGEPLASAKTFALPPAPWSPENLLANGNSPSAINLTWQYNATKSITVDVPASTSRIEAENWATMNGVQTEGAADEGGTLNVGWTDAGDWMDYTVNIANAGSKTMNFRFASPNSGTQIQVKDGSGNVLATVAVPLTGGWQTWQTVSANVTLPAGSQTLRIYALTGGWNLNWFEIYNPASTTTSTQTRDANSFEVYRSNDPEGNYILVGKVPATQFSFLNEGLLANSIFHYKVKAVNDGGASDYSNKDTAITFNTVPAITAIADQIVRFGTSLQVPVTVSDADPGVLNVSVTNLPSFGSFTPSATGGVITFTPALSDVGTYNNITVTVTDANGGTSSTAFKLTVNNNYKPVIAAVSNVTLNEKANSVINLSATDQNAGDVLTWSFTGVPSFATITTGTGTAQLSLAPGYADNGVYTVKALVNDGNDGVDSVSFTITVNDVNPNKTIYVNFTDGTYLAPFPWNNTAKAPVVNDNFAALKDANGTSTTVGVLLTTGWTGVNNAGANTGSNTGIYPDAVLRSSYYTNNTSRTIKVYGLPVTSKNNFTLMASRLNPTVGVVTNFTINGVTQSLNAANNTQNTVTFSNIVPAADGSVSIAIAGQAGSSFGYLNGLVIQSNYDDGSAPAAPRNLTAQMSSGKVRLNWVDAAYNETAYEVYRSATEGGSYTLLNPGGGNAGLQQFDDQTAAGHTTYYYKVRAINTYGSSAYATISFATPNTSPVLAAISNVSMNTQQVQNVSISATDGVGETIVLSATGLPSFATLTDNGNGTGSIAIAPGDASGVFNVTVKATDGDGATATQTFTITVTNQGAIYSLSAVGISKTSVRLNWVNVTNSGYEVWRSSSLNGTYTKIADLATNTVTFTDNSLAPGTLYYYKVKGVGNIFSNSVGVSTVAYTINLNLNDGTVNAPAQPGNWNNTNALISNGFVLSNMINDQGLNTGINFGVVRNFSGFNYLGQTTGNNSGVYPDNVMKSFYYCNYADTAIIKISGLTLSHVYNFVFFGSRTAPKVGVTSAYKIGNKIVTLDATNNTQNTVQIAGIVPDAEGTVTITIYGTQQGGFAYLNELTIQGAPNPSYVPTFVTRRTIGNMESAISSLTPVAEAYPNPFTDDVSLKFDLKENISRFTIQVSDINGRVVYQRDMVNVPKGIQIQKLGLKGKALKSGVYFVKILGLDGESSSIKVMKR